jgi:transposase-like protein
MGSADDIDTRLRPGPGAKRKLTPDQRTEAIRRHAAGETMVEIAKSYDVNHSMISRLCKPTKKTKAPAPETILPLRPQGRISAASEARYQQKVATFCDLILQIRSN